MKSSIMEEVRIDKISPEGWINEYLLLQKNGLTGNLDKIGFPYNQISWAAEDVDTTKENENPGWWVYEQTAYWIDGMERCGALLRDDKLIEKATKSIEYVIEHADVDGYLGPKFLKTDVSGFGRWSHVVFFRALMAEYSRTGDKKLVEAVRRHYLGHKYDYSIGRDVLNVEIMCWVYWCTGDEQLLEMAVQTYDEYNAKCEDDNCVAAMLSDEKAYAHGVTYNEFCKLGAILSICTGDKSYLEPVLKAYEKIDHYQMLPDGLHCSNEFLLDNDYMQSHETCDVSDYTWTLGYLLMATGDGKWADKIERCVFNAGIGSVDDEFRSLQYFSGPNQVIADAHSNHNGYFKGNEWMSYRPFPGTECCTGNVNRFMPNYCARMWMQKGNDIFVNLYGPSTASFDIEERGVQVQQITSYPFEDQIQFHFHMEEPQEFAFYLRIPGWCKNPGIVVNGEEYLIEVKKGFTMIRREFKEGDHLALSLPSEIKICEYHDEGCYVEKGPLVYSLAVEANKTELTDIEKTTKEFPAYDMYPTSAWNYALCAETVTGFAPMFKEKGGDILRPWSQKGCPFEIRIAARQVNGWSLEETDVVYAIGNLYEVPWKMIEKKGKFVFTPRFPSKEHIVKHGYGEEEIISLVPMAATQLRMTIFPKVH